MRYVLLCGLVAATLSGGCDKAKTAIGVKPAPIEIPESWTHKELLDHLTKKGMKIRSVPTNRGFMSGPALFIVAQDSPVTTEDDADKAYEEKKSGVVACILRKTAQEARDDAGTRPNRWASGRFVFAGDMAVIAEIQKHFQ